MVIYITQVLSMPSSYFVNRFSMVFEEWVIQTKYQYKEAHQSAAVLEWHCVKPMLMQGDCWK